MQASLQSGIGMFTSFRVLLCTLLLAIVAFFVLYPAVTLFINSFEINTFSTNPSVGLANWYEVFSRTRLINAIENTITLSVARQFIALTVGIFIAWLIARTNLPHSNWLEIGFWIALFMPALPVTLAWILLAAEGIGLLNNAAKTVFGAEGDIFNIYSWWGIVWVHIMTSTLAIKIFLLVPAFRNVDSALEEAARTCGASILKTLIHIVVPIMLPTIIVVTVLGAIRSLQAFEIELILGSPARIDVYSTAIYKAVNSQPPSHGIASVLSIIFLVAVVPMVAVQQRISAKHSYASISGKFANRIFDLGRIRWPLFWGIATLLVFMTVVPFILLIIGSFMTIFGVFDLPSPWTTKNWIDALSRGDIPRALWNSLKLAGSASVIGMVTYSLIAYVVVKTKFAGRAVLDFLTWVPTIIPGLVLGLGLLQMFAGLPIFRPVYGTMTVLVIAVVIGTLSLGTQIIKSSLLSLGRELEEASWASGASRFYTFRRVIFPLIAPSVIIIGLEVFASGIAVVGLVALLGTGSTQPLSITQLIYIDGGFFGPASVIGIIIMSISIFAALIARQISSRSGLKRAAG
jgi:iron(III) transport system permease protein